MWICFAVFHQKHFHTATSREGTKFITQANAIYKQEVELEFLNAEIHNPFKRIRISIPKRGKKILTSPKTVNKHFHPLHTHAHLATNSKNTKITFVLLIFKKLSFLAVPTHKKSFFFQAFFFYFSNHFFLVPHSFACLFCCCFLFRVFRGNTKKKQEKWKKMWKNSLLCVCVLVSGIFSSVFLSAEVGYKKMKAKKVSSCQVCG